MGSTAHTGGHRGVLVPSANPKTLALVGKRQPFPGYLAFQLELQTCCKERHLQTQSCYLGVSPSFIWSADTRGLSCAGREGRAETREQVLPLESLQA